MSIRLFAYLVFTVSRTLSALPNSLKGKHLHVLAKEFPFSLKIQRNATGHVIQIEGILTHMLAALCEQLGCSYSYLPIAVPSFDDSPIRRGAISYITNNDADYLLATMVATPSRFQKIDFPSSWFYGPFSTLLPYPRETLSLTASFKPLSYEVWILVAIAVFTTVLFLKLLHRWEFFIRPRVNIGVNGSAATESHNGVVLYVLGNLVSQGQHNFSRRLAIRIAAGTWCCGCFFLVQSYCSTLTSHLTSPNQHPLVNSFFEIANKSGVILTLDRGLGIDVLLQTTESPRIKQFVDILKKENRLITCNATADCLEYLKSGNAAFSATYGVLSEIITNDLKKMRTCNYIRTTETFWSSPVFTVLRKNSPYTEIISRGILRLRETGLLAEWEKWYIPSPSKCMKLNEQHDKLRLSLKHLSSSFVILISGCFVSLVAFVIERLLKSRHN